MNGKPLLLLIMVMVVTMGTSIVAVEIQKAKASGTIYINSNGSITPSDAPIFTSDNITYTFTDDINDSIVVLRSNITIDGAGHTLNGTGTGLLAGLTIEYVAAADDNVTVKNVNIMGFGVGIGLISAENITISFCNITNNGDGIWFGEVWNCTISGNLIANNTNGVYLSSAQDNAFYGNNITNNDNGVRLLYSTDNKFYHNYFVDNINQTYVEQGNANIWDDGYPSGGNYWSDFKERYPGVEDNYGGPNQDEPGSDGFWDGPYEINPDNIDNYPIVPEFSTLASTLLILFVLTTAIALYKRRLLEETTL